MQHSRKFTEEGRVLPFSGCTLICHLQQQGEAFSTFDRLLDVYRDLPLHGFRCKLAVLPTSSYHVTIFDLVNDGARSKAFWPAFIPRDAPMEVCLTEIQKRLTTFRLECELPIRMAVDDGEWKMRTLAIPLTPFDEPERKKLLQLRGRLSEALGLTLPQPDTYRFHITIAYRLKQFDNQEEADYERALLGWKDHIRASVARITLGAPELCSFADIFAFQRHVRLEI